MASLRRSQQAIEALIVRERNSGHTARADIVLAGFSQGGALALQAGLRYPEKLAGIMALSAYLPAPQTLAAEATTPITHPIFMAHGDRSDNVVPLVLAQASKRQLHRIGLCSGMA